MFMSGAPQVTVELRNNEVENIVVVEELEHLIG